MARLTSAQHTNAIGRLQTGATQEAVARHFGISRQTISALWAWLRYNTTQSVVSLLQSNHHCYRSIYPSSSSKLTTASPTATQIPEPCIISDQRVRKWPREAQFFPRSPV